MIQMLIFRRSSTQELIVGYVIHPERVYTHAHFKDISLLQGIRLDDRAKDVNEKKSGNNESNEERDDENDDENDDEHDEKHDEESEEGDGENNVEKDYAELLEDNS